MPPDINPAEGAPINTMVVNRPVKIILADDNESTLAAITRFLEDGHFRVVGAVRDGAALVSQIAGYAPDVAVVDIFMPEVNGLDATAQLKKIDDTIKVIILTAHREPEFVRAAFAAGACGYVLKHRLVADLPNAIELAIQGERFLSPTLTISSD